MKLLIVVEIACYIKIIVVVLDVENAQNVGVENEI